MYSTSQMQSFTEKFLNQKRCPPSEIELLRDVIRFHNQQYYLLEDPLIEDSEWDILFHMLKSLETAHPELITADSPTQKIAVTLQDEFQKADHVIPMLSLANAFDAENLRDFDTQISKLLDAEEERTYCMELKFDGISISLHYENGVFLRATTRGDGITGENVTHNIQTIQNIPKKISHLGAMEIRGEIILPKHELERINTERLQNGEKVFVNTRNAASGSVRQLDTKVTAKRNLEGYFYQVVPIEALEFETYEAEIIFLEAQGFTISPWKIHAHNIEKIIEICKEMESKRYDFPFDIDGLVIKLNDKKSQEKIGKTAHHPRWAIAYKFTSHKATTQLLDVSFQVGRTGVITPVAELAAVNLAGVTIRRATLHNFDNIEKKDIRIGDFVIIERAGEVIPAVLSADITRRNGREQEIHIPKNCPSCNSTLFQNSDEVAIRCGNENCPEQLKGRISHLASRNALNIEGLGDALIHILVERKIITKIEDIFSLKKPEIIVQLEKIDGIGPKAIYNLFEALEKSKTTKSDKVLYSLGIPFVGKKVAQILIEACGSIENIFTADEEMLVSIHDIGPKVIASLKAFYANPAHQNFLTVLKKEGYEFDVKNNDANQVLVGKTFVITGTFTSFVRETIEQIISSHGGKISTSVSHNTSYLITGENAGSKLRKAEELGIEILDEDALRTFLKSYTIEIPHKENKTSSQLDLFGF